MLALLLLQVVTWPVVATLASSCYATRRGSTGPVVAALTLSCYAARRGSTVQMMSSTADQLMWSAKAHASEPCDSPRLASYLAERAGDDLVLRLDDSVASTMSLGTGRYRARMHPLQLPGLTVTPTAVIRVAAVPQGLRYTTESVRCEYAGAFSGFMSNLQPPHVFAVSELKASGGALAMQTVFELSMPLPSWWPMREGVATVGSNLIQGITEKDTRLSVSRVKAEFLAGCVTR